VLRVAARPIFRDGWLRWSRLRAGVSASVVRVGGDRRGGQGDLGQGAIGDESGDQAGPGDGSAFVGATGDLEASVHAVDCRAGPRARDLPETAQRVASRRPTSNLWTAALTCAVVWAREVLRGLANHRSIDGKDGVAGSIPAGGSTKAMTSANAGHPRVRRELERGTLVVFASGVGWTGRIPDGEHFPCLTFRVRVEPSPSPCHGRLSRRTFASVRSAVVKPSVKVS